VTGRVAASKISQSVDVYELFASPGIVGRPEKGARVVRPRGALCRGDGRDEVTDQRHGVADADARVLGDAEGPHRGRDDGTLPHAWTLPFPPALRRNRALWRHLRAPPRTRERLTRACVAFPERERGDRRLTRSLPSDSQEPEPAPLSVDVVRAALKVRLARTTDKFSQAPRDVPFLSSRRARSSAEAAIRRVRRHRALADRRSRC
jgi:hypothetical protein